VGLGQVFLNPTFSPPSPITPTTNHQPHPQPKEDPLIKGQNKTQREALLEAFRKDIATLKQFAAAKPSPCPHVLRLFQVGHSGPLNWVIHFSRWGFKGISRGIKKLIRQVFLWCNTHTL
jgi:hypothetical protein